MQEWSCRCQQSCSSSNHAMCKLTQARRGACRWLLPGKVHDMDTNKTARRQLHMTDQTATWLCPCQPEEPWLI